MVGGREKDGGRSLAYRQPSVKVVGDTRNGTRGGREGELGEKVGEEPTSSVSLFPRQRPRIGLPRISGKEEDKRRKGRREEGW